MKFGALQDSGNATQSDVPHAKKPKVRPPRGWRDKVIFPLRSLPTYTGPYSVGTMEIEVPAENPRTFTNIRRDGKHLLQLETVLMTVYYPVAYHDYNLQKHKSGISRELWLGRPRIGMAQGYCKFGGVGNLGLPLFLPAMFTKLPAYRNGPIATYWAPTVNVKTEGPKVKMATGDRPEGAPEEPEFPVVLFSHGLGGTRTMYSSVCGEFASYGFVVCAVEHRDGSGARTYINHAESGLGSMPEREKSGVDHNNKEQRRGYDILDYTFPKDNPRDTAPGNEKGVDRGLREGQIQLRMAELEEAFALLKLINEGNGQSVEDRNLRREGYIGSSSRGLEGVDWARWKGRMRLDHVTACGHSFGAATTIEMLRHDDRFNYIGQGIIYDIWGAGTAPVEHEAPHHRIHTPLLAINSEAFTYWPTNFDLVEELVREAQSEPKPSPAWLLTLRGTVHVSQSDFSLLYPHVCSLALKMVANPQRALDLNINASLEFLQHVLPPELAQVNRAYQNENLLESELSPLDRIPSMQMLRPSEKWVAGRLRIDHEWMYRASPSLYKKLRKRENEKQGHSPEGEIWLHVKPSPESIKRYVQHVKSGGKEKGKGAAPNSGGPIGEQEGEQRTLGLPVQLKKNDQEFVDKAGDPKGDVEHKGGRARDDGARDDGAQDDRAGGDG